MQLLATYFDKMTPKSDFQVQVFCMFHPEYTLFQVPVILSKNCGFSAKKAYNMRKPQYFDEIIFVSCNILIQIKTYD